MKNLVFTIALFSIMQSVYGEVKITGTVKDNRNRPIFGVSVSLKDSYDGATSDSAGNFSFRTSEKGEQTISASSIGYNSYEQKLTIANQPITLTINLKEKLDELKAVMVTAGSFAA